MSMFMQEASKCISDISKKAIETSHSNVRSLKRFFDYVKGRIKEYENNCNQIFEEYEKEHNSCVEADEQKKEESDDLPF